MKQKKIHIYRKEIKYSLYFVLMIILLSFIVGAHHDSAPQGQHQMPNGQIMNNQDMGAQGISKEQRTVPLSVWIVLGMITIFAMGIWLVARSIKRGVKIDN